jgi:hypothetical protein
MALILASDASVRHAILPLAVDEEGDAVSLVTAEAMKLEAAASSEG